MQSPERHVDPPYETLNSGDHVNEGGINQCTWSTKRELPLSRSIVVAASICTWLVVFAGWLFATRGFHPTWPLAIIVTTSLVTAFATASYINHLYLLPRLFRNGGAILYSVSLVLVMILLTAVALLVIRVSYLQLWGPDADPLGVYKHFAIDLFGMAVHVGLAYVVVSCTKWTSGRMYRARTAPMKQSGNQAES